MVNFRQFFIFLKKLYNFITLTFPKAWHKTTNLLESIIFMGLFFGEIISKDKVTEK